MSASTAASQDDKLVLQPRNVEFNWSKVPLHWIPNEPFATHTINVLHLLLPEGERWFIRVFEEALPYIQDEELRKDVLGFIGQEALHADAHERVLDHLKEQGIDCEPYQEHMRWLFHRALGDKPGLSESQSKRYLQERVALIAAIEHFTAFLGQWALDAEGLDAANADPMMVDLLRWHGAEEVEHRSVAFDLAQHLAPSYPLRIKSALISVTTLLALWWRGVRFFLQSDPATRGRRLARAGRYYRASQRGLLPGLGSMTRTYMRYMKPSYHPLQDFNTAQAIAYLATSPAARAAH
ncbi:metal-dependent hydrolase [Haloglycomyces albus]|uniref:metal-dependent hydrolase n=1 Tax=Haloglycomyces albus TaxID=526067 RepID=UPI00046CF614|nr:metal-dependent hydrolase [Haloglycomyces albus]